MIVAIVISVISLIVSVLAYFKQPNEITVETPDMPMWEYTENGIEFYDKTGKKILIKA